MKSFLVTITCLTFLAMATNAQTSSAGDDAQIRDLAQTMEDGWNKKDASLFAKPFAENADYVIINGVHIKGKEAITMGHQSIFDTFYKETSLKTAVESIRYIRPDIAIVHVTGRLTGMSNGQKLDEGGMITLVTEKIANGWQIVAFQNTPVRSQQNRTGQN